MLYSVVLLLVQCFRQSYVLADATYECGEHGRFEYCIDEIPGCVVGCHCHPGYYFDTDTKICEPNSKLLQHHRRHNVVEPTRVLNLDVTSDAAFETETVAPVNNINGHVDEISKDANDLGDWLYNQFFKTIESQVVNNTNEKEVLTRRSGSDYKVRKPKRTNKWRKRTKTFKRRSRNDRLKKKLLRITENDSLFDLASSSSSDSSDSTSSDSSEEVHIKNNVHGDDNEHGHKKIVMINKKPKPPLPNFIFLPNLDTSYYPPLGLPPPPPIVPMYPMVPVPPVVPLYKVQGNCETTSISNNDIATTTVLTSTTTTDVTSDTTKSETITSTEPPPTTNTAATTTALPDKKAEKTLRLMQRERKRKDSRQRNKDLENELGIGNMKPSGRQKFLQRLKGKINKPPKLLPYYNDKLIQEYDSEVPLVDNVPEDVNNEIQYKPLQEEISSLPENVDFKYITELIHRVDLKNKSSSLLPAEYKTLDSIEVFRPPRSHKNYYRYYNSPLNAFDGRRTNRHNDQQQTNDFYYTNLGRQIATMIRGIDSQNDQMKIGMEEASQKINNDPYFNINSQKSFWERSVRSPLTFLNANKNKFEYLKKSNEILFNIENKVEIMASTVPALSLQEIENIVKVMEAAKIDIQGKKANSRNVIPRNKKLDINLWPQEIKMSNQQGEPYKKNDINIENPLISENDQANANNIKLPNFQRFKTTFRNPHSTEDTKHMVPFPKTNSLKKPSSGNSYFVSDPLNYNQVRYSVVNHRQAKSPLSQKPLPQPLLENEMNPLFLKHRKYFQNNNEVVFNQNRNLSRLQSAQKSSVAQPSYFHHQINHFDYIL